MTNYSNDTRNFIENNRRAGTTTALAVYVLELLKQGENCYLVVSNPSRAKDVTRQHPGIINNIVTLDNIGTFGIGREKAKLFFDTDAVFVLAR